MVKVDHINSTLNQNWIIYFGVEGVLIKLRLNIREFTFKYIEQLILYLKRKISFILKN
jgi:hypothetical protein